VEIVIAEIDLNPIIMEWQSISQQLRDLEEFDAAEDVDGIINVYQNIRDSLLPTFSRRLVSMCDCMYVVWTHTCSTLACVLYIIIIVSSTTTAGAAREH